jgi:hypothetical protein
LQFFASKNFSIISSRSVFSLTLFFGCKTTVSSKISAVFFERKRIFELDFYWYRVWHLLED